MADISHWVITFGTTTYSEGTTQGQAIAAVRNDTLATLATADNELAPLQVNASGALYIQEGSALDVSAATVTVDLGANNDVINAGTFAVQEDGAALTALQLIDDIVFADDAAFTLTSSKVAAIGAIRDDALTTLSAVENDVVPLRVSSTGALHVTGGGGGTEYTDDTSTHATGSSLGTLFMAAATPTDGAVDANDIGAVAMSTDRRLLVDSQIVGQDANLTVDLGATDNAVLDNIDTNTTNIPNVIGTDGAAGPTSVLSVGGTESGGNIQEMRVDADGHLQVDVLTGGGSDTPSNPVNNYQTSASLAAGAAVDLTTPEAASKKLTGVEVWSSVAFRARVYTVDNAVESTDPYAVGGAQAFTSWQWKPPHRNYVTLGATAGLDAFRVEVTNLDDSLAADVYATFHYED